jgi:hypothetical protein
MGRTIRKWMNALGRAFLISVVFLIRRWLPLTLSLFAAYGIAYIMKSTSTSVYTSDMILRSNVIENSQLIDYINRINSIDKGDIPKILGIPDSTAENLNDIRAYWIIDKNKDRIPDYVDYKNSHDIYDTTNIRMQDRFSIQIKIKESENLDLLRDGIIKYIESNKLFQQRNRRRLVQNKEMLERVITDIENLDSLQKVKYFEEGLEKVPQTGGQLIFLQEHNTQLLYNEIQDLYYKKQDLETNLEIYRDIITIISELTTPSTRINDLMFYSLKTIPIAIFLTLVILVAIANRSAIKNVFNKYKN